MRMSILLILCSSLASCAATQTAERPPAGGDASSGGAPARELRRPFVVREADLPEGFPAPGPVGHVLVKRYPAYRLARVRSGVGGIDGGPNAMFRPLYNHIRRGNIPMTVPVELGYSSDVPGVEGLKSPRPPAAESMAFLYGRPVLGRPGTDQEDPRVIVEDVPAMTVLSVGVRGDYTDANFATGLKKLNDWMAANPGRVRVVGSPRYLAYNSPFVLGFLKYGEVQLPVECVSEMAEASCGAAGGPAPGCGP